MRTALWALGLLVGCGGGAGEISGSFGDHEMTRISTAFHGGPNILLVQDDMDCLDAAWVDRNYGDTAPEDARTDFLALQFAYVGGDVTAGHLSLEGVSSVRGFAIAKEGDSWEVDNATGGTIDVTSVGDAVEGTFEVDLGGVGGHLSGSFTTEYCRNIDP